MSGFCQVLFLAMFLVICGFVKQLFEISYSFSQSSEPHFSSRFIISVQMTNLIE
jgi:hypothetical protein